MRFFAPFQKVDDEARMVYGYASTEAVDSHGETVRRSAVEAALPEFMRFANIREMHQPSAVGKAQEADVDDKGLWLGAKVVDDAAWNKVKQGVYSGFSIGGRVTARDPVNRKIITGVSIGEISLVDRPANPEATFDFWKSADAGENDMAQAAPRKLMLKFDGDGEDKLPAFPPIEIDGEAGVIMTPDLEAALGKAFPALLAKAAKAEGDYGPHSEAGYADPGYQDDKKPRYPLKDGGKLSEKRIRAAWSYIHKEKDRAKYSTEQVKEIEGKIVDAWKAAIDKDGPPSAEDVAKRAKLAKGMGQVIDFAVILDAVGRLMQDTAWEAAVEADGSDNPAKIKAWLTAGVAIFGDVASEEAEELTGTIGDVDVEDGELELVAKAARLIKRLGEIRKARKRPAPKVGDKVEFASDQQTEKGPSSGKIKTVDGDKVTVAHSDGEEDFNWPAMDGDLKEGADGERSWLMKRGARNSKADLARLQGIHDHAVSLGASCEGAGEDAANDGANDEAAKLGKGVMALPADSLVLVKGLLEGSAGAVDALRKALLPNGDEAIAKSLGDLGGRFDGALAKAAGDMTASVKAIAEASAAASEKLAKRLEDLERMPAAPKGVLRAVGRGDDLDAATESTTSRADSQLRRGRLDRPFSVAG